MKKFSYIGRKKNFLNVSSTLHTILSFFDEDDVLMVTFESDSKEVAPVETIYCGECMQKKYE